MNKIQRKRIAILDDLYPHPISRGTWRGVEFEEYLRHFPHLQIYTTLASRALVDNMTETEIMDDFKHNACFSWNTRTHLINDWNSHKIRCPDLFYCIFINNAYLSLPTFQRLNKPFLFTLYPGGGFRRYNEESDKKLKTVFDSPLFSGVLVTSSVIRDYLVENNFCSETAIKTIWGGVHDEGSLLPPSNKTHFGFEKQTLDIVFSANRYMPHGEDKGYDIFIDAARILAQQRDDVRFHVVGNYDESIVDITGLENRITFYGMQPLPFFDKFYRDKDILISPNRSGVLDKGAFDGFPTGCAVDALVRETAIFCTDNAGNGQNCGQYENGKEIVLTTSNAESIAQQVNQYASNPARLKSLCELGAKKAHTLYSYKNQLEPRIEWIEEALSTL